MEELPTPASISLGDTNRARLMPLATEASDFAANARSEATRRAYASDWRAFTAWTTENHLDPLPAEPATVALYAAHLARNLRPSTIGRKMAAIAAIHEHHGHPSPTRHPAVRDVLAGVRRTLGIAPTQAAPAVIGEVRRMVAHLPQTTAGMRDRALILTGFAGAMRRSELVALKVADLQRRDEGLLVRVRRSKGDQEGAGQSVALPFGHDPETCPVHAIDAWLDVASIAEGPLFRPVNRGGNVADQPLTAQSVALIVKAAATGAGLDPNRYSGHSLRAGSRLQRPPPERTNARSPRRPATRAWQRSPPTFGMRAASPTTPSPESACSPQPNDTYPTRISRYRLTRDWNYEQPQITPTIL